MNLMSDTDILEFLSNNWRKTLKAAKQAHRMAAIDDTEDDSYGAYEVRLYNDEKLEVCPENAPLRQDKSFSLLLRYLCIGEAMTASEYDHSPYINHKEVDRMIERDLLAVVDDIGETLGLD